jgi:hypothetical protein
MIERQPIRERNVKDVAIGPRAVRYGKGPVVTHHDAWVVFAHERESCRERSGMR